MIYSWSERLNPIYSFLVTFRDTENAGWCIYLYIMGKFMLGSPIQPMMNDLEAYAKQMKELKRDIVVARLYRIAPAEKMQTIPQGFRETA